MLRLEQTYFIKASPARVWAALTDPALLSKWTGQPAEYDARVGGAYRLWTEYVHGEVVECDPPKKLAQTWNPNDWTIQDSVVTFTLNKVRGGTQLDLVHENVEPNDFDGTANGWGEFYIGAIKAMLEAENPKPKPKQVRQATRAKKVAAKTPAKKKAQALNKRVSGAPKTRKPPMKKKKTAAKRK